tara:strand:+ start:4889 stop:5947 length:1059 start_codon:yes stop_codon:yes gene_type:complete
MSTLSSRELIHKSKKKISFVLSFLVIFLVFTLLAGSLMGPASTIFDSIDAIFASSPGQINDLIWKIRLPRAILGFLTGGALALSGAALQSLFNNPLADSGLIGISSGAILGVILGVLFGAQFISLGFLFDDYSFLLLPTLAFLGAIMMSFLVYRLSSVNGKIDIAIMLLSGIAINAFAGAFSGLLINVANDDQLRTITFWSLGSLNSASWTINFVLIAIILFGSIGLFRLSKELETLGLGEREALALGVNIDLVKRKVLIFCALICGPVVAFTGLIGFVGLVIPHLLRLIIGSKVSQLMYTSFLLGGSFLVLADIGAKLVIAPAELPIGIITSLIGTPFFMYLLIKQKRYSA